MKITTSLMIVVASGALLACFNPVTLVAALPPDPDNAALLYYQAFLLVPRTEDRALTDLVANVANGTVAPNEPVKEYVKKCSVALDLAVAATERRKCDWGLCYSKGFSMQMPPLAHVRSLSRLILTDARIQAAETNYRPALERCLTAYRLAGHSGSDVLISFLVSVAVSAQANKAVTDILGQMPADDATLTWFKGQLATLPAITLTANKAMALEREVALQTMHPERVAELAGILAESSGKSVEEIRNALNEQVLQRAREYYSKSMDSVLTVLTGPMPYVEGYAKLQGLAQQMEQDVAKDPALQLVGTLAPAVAKIYVLQVRHQTDANALQAALDVYLAKAGTGRLPTSLPAAAPRDPYTGNAFQYEPTGDAFVLRCGAKDFDKNEVREYRFATPK